MRNNLLLVFVCFALYLNGQEATFIQTLDTLKKYYSEQEEITSILYKNNKKIDRIRDTSVLKKRATKFLDIFTQSSTVYENIRERSLKIYELADAYTIELIDSWSDEEKNENSQDLIRSMEKVEEFCSNIYWNAERNRELSKVIVEHLQTALRSDFPEEIYEMMEEVIDLSKESLFVLKRMYKNIKATEKYCIKLSELDS